MLQEQRAQPFVNLGFSDHAADGVADLNQALARRGHIQGFDHAYDSIAMCADMVIDVRPGGEAGV